MHTHTPRLPASEAYKLQSLRFASGRTPQPSTYVAPARPAPAPRTPTHIAGRHLTGPATA